jgi:hypothetical protein
MTCARTGRPPPRRSSTPCSAQLVDAVAELVHSDKWAQMLAVAARLTTDSPSNVLLIAAQRPDAIRVAGIRIWNSLGRHVLKGEHGIAILAPCLHRTEGEAVPSRADGRGPQPTDEGPMPRRELRGFRVVHVFDVTQTDGAPLPSAAPQLLTGDAPRRCGTGSSG